MNTKSESKTEYSKVIQNEWIKPKVFQVIIPAQKV